MGDEDREVGHVAYIKKEQIKDKMKKKIIIKK